MKELKRRHIPYTKFKAYLFEKGLSQQDLAKMLGKSRYAVNQNLNGTGGDFSLTEVRKMCAIFSIQADDYFIYPQVSITKQKEANYE